MIYMDNAASEKPLPCAVRAFHKTVKKHYANPHSAHRFGMESKAVLEQARETIAECINCRPNEVYFTSGATEACNWAIDILSKNCASVISDGTEHSSVSARKNYRFSEIKHGQEQIGLIYTLVNNETGKINLISKKTGRNTLIFCDATAAIGNIPVDFEESGIDYMAFGAHKFGGLPGIGCLIVRKSAPIQPFIHGGGEKYRAGTPCIALAAAMAAALKYREKTKYRRMDKLKAMRKIFLTDSSLQKVMSYYDFTNQAPNILSLTFPGVEGSALVAMMSEKFGTMVSTGAACNSGENEPSSVLLAHGYTEGDAKSTIRVSLSERNTVRECKLVARQLACCAYYLKNF